MDTGFFRPLANTLALSTSGNERLRVDSSGRVGIGTTSPALRLTLAGSGAFNSVSAAAILLDNTSANGRRWEWHALDNGKIQLADYDAAATRLVVDTNGSVGIGTGSPAVPLHVDGGTDASLSGGGYIVAGAINGLNVVIDNNEIMARSNGVAANLSLNYDAPNRDDSPTDSPVITVSGDGLAPRHDNYTRCGYLGGQAWAGVNAYSFNNASDARLKDNIQPTHYGLQTVLSLRPVSYQWKKKTDGRMNLGLIAQEVEPIVPEAVVKGENPEHTLGLSYNSFIPILIKAVQEQQSLIDAQHVENAELKRRLDKLELLVSARNGGAK